MKTTMHENTHCIHGGKSSHANGPLSTPIYQSSTFVFESAEQGAARFAGEQEGYIYSRLGNPTTRELEQKMALLEQMDDAAACATGMGAVSAAVLSFLQQGDHLIASKAIYGCTFAFFAHMLPKWGIEVSFVDMTDPQALEAAYKANTKMVFAETPINPNLTVLDLKYIGDFAKKHQILSVIDNTFLTPLLQKPKQFGIDIVIHSATKYLNGHGDVVAGIVCANQEHINLIKLTVLKDIGATMSPHDAWLIIRGMKTLAVRMEKHCQNAQKVAEFLEGHPEVECVYYPGLPSHPGHKYIGEQMKAAGGVIGFELKGGIKDGVNFINATELCSIAVSLGDAETLIQHPASMTHSPYTPEERQAAGISDGLIRISVGLEFVDDIIADLSQAFNVMIKKR
ncbi:trans-sulfuration enzyme family protein [Pseudoalteromonas tunicata]|uniref:Probable Methionine gamma-lyase n=1 Tax=Pseudoalteromonas tunicata D2 TaxID=87626 RepID=A4CDA9_9GAMM|nr:aminotransferase class I/II-fold pyridoxal phosphate-dependent enzyme [Pseudoalteromonas tunicata]ATC94058.1 methionine-gamma-lyase [Pseudoalteromonas tunicata]AXT29840.1 aminotransferase class I/II-fold pyridoxal phosphate-dependent enzyme [Pseudoalteromonas tunicata]EAR27552.1 probable Methionine gamma-lyase [Pseudoalteromonas tunicata D2]MDP4984051.1 aminotransferase class I/II-fold pyridoxal phosphate-dependent enzyme [Pseudoalteromonas tunicata]MDP5213790.1 aminotransferase class I/II-